MGDKRILVSVIIGILILGTLGFNQEIFSTTFPGENGKIIYASTQEGNLELFTIDEDGTNQNRLTFSGADDRLPRYSSDGEKIVWEKSSEAAGIFTMQADGTNQKKIFNDFLGNQNPTWSPDGTRIAFVITFQGIFVMNSDGSNPILISSSGTEPSWSPDGTKILFRDNHLFTINPDGTGLKNLTPNVEGDFRPAWSPDGTKIVFDRCCSVSHEIWVMNSDGSGQTRLTFNIESDTQPKFSPDGTKIVFISNRDGSGDLFVMNSDGTNQQNISNSPLATEVNPDWQPLNLLDKEVICHNAADHLETITVSRNAVQSHIDNHGDTLGPCGEPVSLTVIKEVIGGSAEPDDFDLTVNGNPVLSGQTVVHHTGKTLSIGETQQPDYFLSEITGDGCPANLVEPFRLNQDTICTIVNIFGELPLSCVDCDALFNQNVLECRDAGGSQIECLIEAAPSIGECALTCEGTENEQFEACFTASIIQLEACFASGENPGICDEEFIAFETQCFENIP